MCVIVHFYLYLQLETVVSRPFLHFFLHLFVMFCLYHASYPTNGFLSVVIPLEALHLNGHIHLSEVHLTIWSFTISIIYLFHSVCLIASVVMMMMMMIGKMPVTAPISVCHCFRHSTLVLLFVFTGHFIHGSFPLILVPVDANCNYVLC